MPRASIVIVCHQHVDLLADCIRSLRRNVPRELSETIVLFNGTDPSLRGAAQAELEDARVLVSEVNLGFGEGSNRAASCAQGEFLVFLNDDAEVQSGWLESLIETADEHPDAGAVGGRILYPDGRLQEAGSLVWQDGSTIAIGRGLPAGSRRYDYLREVDYISASSLLVRRETFERVGGFDPRYFPAYNEDVDLCLSIRRLGQRILYQPRSVIVHHESQSSAEAKTFLILRGRELLREKWGAELGRFAEPRLRDEMAKELALQRARGNPRRVLIIDDRIPNPAIGSGFRRMLDAARELAEARYAVSLYLMTSKEGDRRELQDSGIEVVEDELVEHLANPATIYEVAIVSRPHNFKTVSKLRRFQPHAAVIYDAEALYHRRLEREAALLQNSDPEAAQRALVAAEHEERRERRIVRTVDRVTSVSPLEAKFLRSIPGHCPVEVIAPLAPEARFSERAFEERSGLVFVAGWLAPYPSPNSDGLEWFAREVLPHIRRRVPWLRLSVTGANPPPEVVQLRGPSVSFLGHVDDLAEVYGRARAAIVPVRYGAGIKIKAVEALQYGVPVIATSIGAEGMDGLGTDAIAVADDAEAFASEVVAMTEDRDRWEDARAAISQIAARWESSERRSWASIVETALMEKTHGGVAIHG